MAWTRDITPGKNYTWVTSDAKGDIYSEINPGLRDTYEAGRARQGGTYKFPWEIPGGRGRRGIDSKYWVKPGPSYDDRSGYATNIDREIDRATGKFNAVGPGITSLPEYVMQTGASEEEELDKKRKEFDHSMWAHMKLPSFDILGKVGDVAKDAFRANRLHSDYKDRAVAAGGTKAEGSKAWERDKRAMMTAEDRAFEKKYLNLAAMAPDNEKRDEYLATAETAWRNKQTSDRLAAATGFEGYAPGKYTGVGEGSRYTGGQRLVGDEMKVAGDRVPGYERMREVYGNLYPGEIYYPGQGSPRSRAEGQDAIASQMVDLSGRDLGGPSFDDSATRVRSYPEYFRSGIAQEGGATSSYPVFDDITDDIDFRSGIGQEGGYTEISRPPGGYLDFRDTLPQEPSFWEAPFEHIPFYSSPFDFNFSPEGWDQGYPGQDLEFLLDPEEYYEDLRDNNNKGSPFFPGNLLGLF